MNGFSEVQGALQDRPQNVRQPVASTKRVATQPAVQSVAQPVAQPATSLWALYRHRWTSRRALLELTEAELQDIGLNPGMARIEAAKPFWRQ